MRDERTPSGVTAERAGPVVWLIIGVGALLRFALLGKQSFWYDETVSADMARLDLWQVAIGHVRDLGNPPLHTLLLGVWGVMFGQSDAALRAMSALIGTLTLPLEWAIGWRLVGRRAALIALALFALSPLHVYMSQETRSYALVTLTTLLSSYALLRAIEAPRANHWWALHALATFLSAYAHYFAFMLGAGQLCYVLVVHRHDRVIVVRYLLAVAAAGILFSFWLPALVAQMTTKGNLGRSVESWRQHFAASPLVFGVGTTLAWKALASHARVAIAALTMVVLAAGIVLGLRAIWPKRVARDFLLVWLLSPLVLPLVISLVLFPFFTVRYGIIALPPYLLLLGAGLASSQRASLLLVPLGGAIAFSLLTYFTMPFKAEWRSAAAYVDRHATPADVLLFDGDFHEQAYARYGKGEQLHLRLLAAEQPGHVEGVDHAGGQHRDLRSEIITHPTVWLLESDPDPVIERNLRALLGSYTATDRHTFRGVELTCFRKNP